MRNKRENTLKHPIFFLGILVCISLLFISVGFSALSTTLTIDGSTAFVPVGLIRVLSINQDSLVNATEVSKGVKPDAIKNTIDFDNINGYATYEVTIKNLGQIDYVLDHVDDVVFSNNQVEYTFDGFQIGNVIKAHEEKKFKVKFKYKDNIEEELVSRFNSELKFVFEEYKESTPFELVFNHEGECVLNGTEGISGSDCKEYKNKTYIDTGIALYSKENWEKDYEIGFTINEYTSSIQPNQAVFINTKNEVERLGFPGLVFRRESSTKDLEITQTISGNKVTQKISNYTLPLDVKIFRINGVIYYSLNGGELISLQEMKNFNQQFDVTAWFGAAPDENGNPMRVLSASLSNMYIKLGKYTQKSYTITFEPNGGLLEESSRIVAEYTKVGTLPIPTSTSDAAFLGWYSNPNFTKKVDENTIFSGDTTLYAKWSSAGSVIMNGKYYTTLEEAITAAPTGEETVISINEDIKTKITIPADKNIVFDLGEYTLSNSQATFVVENNGILKVNSGTITCNSNTATINNNSTGTLIINGGRIVATGTKQAVYNNGGNVTITKDAYLSSTSSIRSTVHNLNNGTLTITGGTIISTNQEAINNEKGDMIIGINDNIINKSPVIQGKTYGITSSGNYKLYDGTIKGITDAVNNQSKITEKADDSRMITGTEQIDGKTYKTLYLEYTKE